MIHSILKTKTQIPPLFSHDIQRFNFKKAFQKSLFLQHGFSRKLTLVSAPAGFGKSKATRQAIEIDHVFKAWYSIDKEDNFGHLFWIYLIDALQNIDLTLGKSALDILHSFEMDMTMKKSFHIVTSALLNDLHKFEKPIILVLDDYHLIDQPKIHQEINKFIEKVPESFHMVILTRSDPPFTLSKWYAKGIAISLRFDALKFSFSETKAFLNTIFSFDLSDELLDKIDKKIDGWPSALSLVGASLSHHKYTDTFIHNFSGTHRHIFNFLAEEIYNLLPIDVRHFLAKTSILTRFDSNICNHILNIHNAHEIILSLESQNIFIIALDHEDIYFRYHHLFSDFLKHQLKLLNIDIDQLYQLASSFYLMIEEPVFAMNYALECKNQDLIGQILESHIQDILLSEGVKIIEVINNLPLDVLKKYPKLLCYAALYHLIYKGHDGLARYLEAATTLSYPSQHNQVIYQGMVFAIKTYDALYKQDYEMVNSFSKMALDMLPKENVFWRMMIFVLLGDVKYFQNNPLSAYTMYEQAHQALMSHKLYFMAISTFIKKTVALIALGLIEDAEKTCKEGLELSSKQDFSNLSKVGTLWILLGEIYREKGDFKTALPYLLKGYDIGKDQKIYTSWNLLYIIHYYYSTKDFIKALKHIEEVRHISTILKIPYEIKLELFYLEIMILIENKQYALASEKITTILNSTPTHIGYEKLLILKIKTDILKDQPLEALKTIETIIPGLKTHQSIKLELTTLVLKSIVLVKLGEIQKAKTIFKECLDISSKHHLYTSFKEALSNDDPLIHSILESDPLLTQIQKIDNTIIKKGLIEPLSSREIELLKLIEKGYTNHDICQELFISISTVKWHLSNIYSKLHVKNRTQALKSAKSYDII